MGPFNSAHVLRNDGVKDPRSYGERCAAPGSRDGSQHALAHQPRLAIAGQRPVAGIRRVRQCWGDDGRSVDGIHMGTATLTIGRSGGEWRRRLEEIAAWCRRSIRVRAVRRALAVEQTVAIGNKASLALVSIGGERVLVAATNGCVRFHVVRPAAALDLPIGGSVQ